MSDARRIQLQEAFKLALSITRTEWLGRYLNWPSPKNVVIASATEDSKPQ